MDGISPTVLLRLISLTDHIPLVTLQNGILNRIIREVALS
ncbi:hypothetical protein LEP1GSC188_4648 [Leptospira weilii serovar Topaz str. LT2116]|uniref:Uncharacterized protein n=1 Tax=Leptospira weilii serovar Topaz str. LT2116 TaxID=1088540 RepID=M3EH48_9LEPT|nr:hypothetical protein LEP1GSC188_4648 [Leptospira weilii serovar Topaz str. LT2116]